MTSAVPRARCRAQGAEIGLQDEVAVAFLPAGRLVARHRLHIHVISEEIVAGMGFLVAPSAKNWAWNRLPIRRPCMSAKAATTVSIARTRFSS